jgi:hypothetical protein
MTKLRGLVLMLVVMLAACLPGSSTTPKSEPIDETRARGSVIQMGYAVQAAAEHCTAHARWMAKFGAEQEANADRLFEVCVNVLIPARDAVFFAFNQIDPWTSKSGAVVGCVGKSVHGSLDRLRDTFVRWQVKQPPLMLDGIRVATWAEQWAQSSCDPEHPTTTVDMFEDPNIPRVEPDYPTWPPITMRDGDGVAPVFGHAAWSGARL